jgi:hypothetical protein
MRLTLICLAYRNIVKQDRLYLNHATSRVRPSHRVHPTVRAYHPQMLLTITNKTPTQKMTTTIVSFITKVALAIHGTKVALAVHGTKVALAVHGTKVALAVRGTKVLLTIHDTNMTQSKVLEQRL